MTRARDPKGLVLPCVGALGAVLALASCSPPAPEGQVVALVNGQEVTLNDLDAEARSAGIAGGPQMTPVLLRRVIDRALLAQTAKKEELDQYPGYAADKTRISQEFLASLALRHSLKTETQVSDDEARAYMAANPQAFANRQKLRVDQVVFSGAILPSTVKSAPNVDAAVKALEEMGASYTRKELILDTLTLPRPDADRLSSAQTGVLTFNQVGGSEVGTLILARTPVPMIPEVALGEARYAASLARTRADTDSLLRNLWSGAVVRLQSGYDTGPR